MYISKRQIEGLTRLIGLTRENELNCSECLDHVAEFAECKLAGKPVSDALEAVSHHLSVCTECREEYEALLVALASMDGGNQPSD